MSPTRRDFLKASLGTSTLLSFGAGVPAWLSRAAMAVEHGSGAGDTVLVVVQLKGGNDGLNTVVPYADDEYAKSRPTLHLKADELHKLDSHFGFHPQMEAFARLFKGTWAWSTVWDTRIPAETTTWRCGHGSRPCPRAPSAKQAGWGVWLIAFTRKPRARCRPYSSGRLHFLSL
jgi:hypothetical protein